jgi:hypothetical protein
VKAFSLFTQQPTGVASLPADLRAAVVPTDPDRVYLKDVDPGRSIRPGTGFSVRWSR